MGAAKTRLARDVGPAEAMRLYRAMMARILRAVRDPRWDIALAVTPDATARARIPVWPSGIPRIPQGGGDLGARQARLLARRGPTALIGADAPDVTASDVARAFAALRRAGSAVGPAADGGYWLLALNGPAPAGLFDGVRWSSPHTLADLAPRLPGPVVRLRELADLDGKPAGHV